MLLLFVACFFAVGYCNTDFCALPGHLLCKVPFNNTGSCTLSDHRFDPENKADQIKILKYLNDFRAKVASGIYKRPGMEEKYPPASNMVELEWDEECASAAQTLAFACFELEFLNYEWPPCCRCNILSKFEVALFYSYVSTEHWGYAIDSALNDNSLMNITSDFIRNYSESAVAKLWEGYRYSFPTIARANMRYVGCNIHSYKHDYDVSYLHTDVICILGGVQDFYEHPIYEAGRPCSNCPLGARCSETYPSLCKCQTDTCSVPPNPNTNANYESPFCPNSGTKGENKGANVTSTTDEKDSTKQSTLHPTTGKIGLEYIRKESTIAPVSEDTDDLESAISRKKEGSHELDDGLAKQKNTGQKSSKKPPSKKKCKRRKDQASASNEVQRIEKSLLWILVTLHTAIFCSLFP